MSTTRSRRALATSGLGLAFALASASCDGQEELCTKRLDFTLARLDDELDVTVSGCTDRGTARYPGVLSLDLDVRTDVDPQRPFAVAVDGGAFAPDGPPWLVHEELYLERNECGRMPIRLHRLDEEAAISLSGSLDAQLLARPGASCEVSIEEQ